MTWFSLPFILLTVSTSGTPGPINITVASMSAQAGWRRSLSFVAGSRACGFAMILALATGWALPLVNHPAVRVALLVGGSVYLFYLAATMLLGSSSKAPDLEWRSKFRQGALIQLSNPKAWISLATISALFVPATAGAADIIGLTVAYVVISTPPILAWGILGDRFGAALAGKRQMLLLRAVLAAATVAVIPMLWLN